MQHGDVPYGLLEDGAVVLENEHIIWCGARKDLSVDFNTAEKIDLEGRLVTPALIDCHTHTVYGGNRALEFEMRLNGATYEDLAQAGGGILSTVAATRDASETELVADALSRVDAFIAEGVSTIEIKSGYGLDRETELKMLRVARKIAEERDVDVITTYLGAHAVPLEYSGRENAYIDEICLPTLRIAVEEGLVDSVDAFCEGIAFQPDEVAKVFDLACELGLPIKIHAEQLSNIGGAKLAARYNALSADHLEYLDEQGAAAMASAGTVAVILPGAFYTLSETQKPPIYMLRHYSIPIAIATDANPGSSPMTSLLLAMNMVCTLFQMTPEEALIGTTRNAACALGLGDRGVVQEGYRADLAVWDIRHPSELAYRIGFNSLKSRIIGGKL
ncbi:imidazolonepropionase [Paracoccaceae bacterium]|nr:imidazolonepropionase [Paracoccaceae bacterium]